MNTKFFISADLLFASHYLFSSVNSYLYHLPSQTMKKEKTNTFFSSRGDGQRTTYVAEVFSSGVFSLKKIQLKKGMKEEHKTI